MLWVALQYILGPQSNFREWEFFSHRHGPFGDSSRCEMTSVIKHHPLKRTQLPGTAGRVDPSLAPNFGLPHAAIHAGPIKNSMAKLMHAVFRLGRNSPAPQPRILVGPPPPPGLPRLESLGVMAGKWGFLKIGLPFLAVPKKRTTVFWCLNWGPPILILGSPYSGKLTRFFVDFPFQPTTSARPPRAPALRAAPTPFRPLLCALQQSKAGAFTINEYGSFYGAPIQHTPQSTIICTVETHSKGKPSKAPYDDYSEFILGGSFDPEMPSAFSPACRTVPVPVNASAHTKDLYDLRMLESHNAKGLGYEGS